MVARAGVAAAEAAATIVEKVLAAARQEVLEALELMVLPERPQCFWILLRLEQEAPAVELVLEEQEELAAAQGGTEILGEQRQQEGSESLVQRTKVT